MGSWWAHCIQKEGLKFDQKLKGIFWVILYEPWWARKRRLCYLWLLSGAYEPSKGFLPFLVGKSIISRKKREPCLSPHARGLMFCVSKILAGPGFWNVSFISENPGGTGTYYYETNQATRASAKEPAPHPRVVQRPPLVRRAAGLLRQHEALRTRVAEDRPAGRSRTYAENQRIQIYGRIFQVE